MAKVDHKPTQNERILMYIDIFGSITQFEEDCHVKRYRMATKEV